MTNHALCLSDYCYSFDRISVVVNNSVVAVLKKLQKMRKFKMVSWKIKEMFYLKTCFTETM